jgi:hypothetical protein
MAFIRTVSETEATGKLRELYDQNIATRGDVPNSIKVMSLRPEAPDAWQKLKSARGYKSTRCTPECQVREF